MHGIFLGWKRDRVMAAVLAAALGAACGMAGLLTGIGGAAAQQGGTGFDFAAPPSAQANRVFGVNRKTGEMNACQFERPEGSAVGVTRCFAQGEGAGPLQAGDFTLIATRYEGETGVFRVNRATGEMSICYVREAPGVKGAVDSLLVCTAPAR